MLELKSGIIPKSIEDDTTHLLIRFNDDYWFVGRENNLYGFGGNCSVETLCQEEGQLIYVHEFPVKVYNPLSKEYDALEFDKFYERNSSNEIDTYTCGYKEFLEVNYDTYSNWLWFDLKSYLHSHWNKEIVLLNEEIDLYSPLEIYVQDEKVLKDFLRQYNRNFSISFENKNCDGYIVGFNTPQSFYSFIQELKEELSKIKFGNKYSEMYDDIVSGKLSKDEFLKSIV